jgi:hypothetical protein
MPTNVGIVSVQSTVHKVPRCVDLHESLTLFSNRSPTIHAQSEITALEKERYCTPAASHPRALASVRVPHSPGSYKTSDARTTSGRMPLRGSSSSFASHSIRVHAITGSPLSYCKVEGKPFSFGLACARCGRHLNGGSSSLGGIGAALFTNTQSDEQCIPQVPHIAMNSDSPLGHACDDNGIFEGNSGCWHRPHGQLRATQTGRQSTKHCSNLGRTGITSPAPSPVDCNSVELQVCAAVGDCIGVAIRQQYRRGCDARQADTYTGKHYAMLPNIEDFVRNCCARDAILCKKKMGKTYRRRPPRSPTPSTPFLPLQHLHTRIVHICPPPPHQYFLAR